MTSISHRFVRSPLRMILFCQLAAVLLTGAFIVLAVHRHKADPAATGWLTQVGGALRSIPTGAGGMTLLWTILIPLAGLLVASLVLGLVYGRWGLPGHMQGSSVYFVPPLAAVYFIAGTLVLFAVDGDGLAAGWTETQRLVTSVAGLTLVGIYAALSTSAVGVGWAVALAVTWHKRARGKWETVPPVDHPAA